MHMARLGTATALLVSALLLHPFALCNTSQLERALQGLRDPSSQDDYMTELRELVAFPSVSALPEHWSDTRAAAEWLVNRLQRAGLEAQLYDTDGPHPAVTGQWLGAPGRPTILVYGHFDVQPVDPLDEWLTEPFKLALKGDGYVYGRGVDDDKGPVLMAIQAVEALLKASSNQGEAPGLPVNVKFLLEGQEEVMSPDLNAFLRKHKDLLAADLCLSADGGQVSEHQGSISLGLRGIVSMQVDVVTAATDMHSGLKGGSVPNANHVLVELLAGLRDWGSGRVLVEGFYEGVEAATQADRADADKFAQVAYSEEEEAGVLGLLGYHGETGFSTLERRWYRPTLEVVGMQGGFTGDGIKTVIPRAAFAKLACRLIPGQTPANIFAKVQAHLLQHAPHYASVNVTRLGGGALAWTSDRDTIGNRAAAKVLHEVMGTPPLYRRDGGTIPALAELQAVLNVPTTIFAFALGEGIHAPNERLKQSMFSKGREAWARLLWELGQAAHAHVHAGAESAAESGAGAATGAHACTSREEGVDDIARQHEEL